MDKTETSTFVPADVAMQGKQHTEAYDAMRRSADSGCLCRSSRRVKPWAVVALSQFILFAWCAFLTLDIHVLQPQSQTAKQQSSDLKHVQSDLLSLQVTTNLTGSSMYVTYNGELVRAFAQVLGYEWGTIYIPANASTTTLPDAVWGNTSYAGMTAYQFENRKYGCCGSPLFYLTEDYQYFCNYHAQDTALYGYSCVLVAAACRFTSMVDYTINDIYSATLEQRYSLITLYLSYANSC